MPLRILGLNHNTAPVEIREQIAFAGEALHAALAAVAKLPGVDETVLLSTCNRTEFYVAGDDAVTSAIGDWLGTAQGLAGEQRDCLFDLGGDLAVRHLFRVACGLDSMVLGEPQILGQLKEAVRAAERQGTVGPMLGRLFQHTFSVAKKVRSDTAIGTSPVSVAYAAVTLAQQFFSGFGKHTAVLVGAGATIELVARHLHGQGIGRLLVANRSLEHARAISGEFGGYALPLSELGGSLAEADLLITSTASEEPVITSAQLHQALKLRRRRPILAVDIAVPRDIEPAAAELEDLYLYSIDDLQQIVMDGQASREAAAADAGTILDRELERYLAISRARRLSPLISALRDHGDAVRNAVLVEARRRLAAGQSADDVLDYALAALLKKLLHNPTVTLRQAAERGDDAMVAAARSLFGIDPD